MADTANKAGADAEGVSSSIAAAAQKYESEHSPPKKNLAEIQVMTGEEDERNVVQVRVEYAFIHIVEPSMETHTRGTEQNIH